MTFTVEIDWTKTGVFEDVTDRMRGRHPVSVRYGRDNATALAPTLSGDGSITLDNSDRALSPRNTASPLYGLVKPARPVRITRTIGGVTYTVFDGHTDAAPINPDPDAKTVTLSLVDWLSDFRSQDITTDLHRGIRTGEAIGLILDACGWPADKRDIDPGGTVIRWWWESGTDALEALEKVVRSEGPPAMLTVAPDGAIVFRDRFHRVIRAASLVTQGVGFLTPDLSLFPSAGGLYPSGAGALAPSTALFPSTTLYPGGTSVTIWNSTGGGLVMNRPFSYDEAWQNIINSASVSVEVRTPSPEAVVWQADTMFTLGGGESTVVSATGSDPFYDAVTPVAGIDYTVVSGGVSMLLLRDSGLTAPIKITALTPSVISGLQLRAHPVGTAHTVQVSAEDTGSAEDYGRRSPPGDLPWCDPADAQAVLTRIVATRANPLPIVYATFLVGTDQVKAAGLLGRNLSDRITLTEPETGLNAVDFYVESIQHDFTGPHDHTVTFGLEAVPVEATPLLRFDDPAAGFDLGRFGSGLDDPGTIMRFDVAGHGFDGGAWAL